LAGDHSVADFQDGFINLIDALCSIGDAEQEWRIKLTLKYLVKLFKGSEMVLVRSVLVLCSFPPYFLLI
jgi:hypothetical protein